MEAWAAFVAIDEAYHDCKLAREPVAAQFESALDRLLDALDRFDDVLQEPDNLALLSLLTGTQLLKNWKQLLAGHYREVFPWWLDGTLEAAERRIERELQLPVQPQIQDRPVPLPLYGPPQLLSVGYLLASGAETDAASTQPARPFASSRHWASPDGTLKASLRSPALAKRGQQVALEFVHVDSSPAVELQGESVLLAGEASRIDENGIARFDLASLQAKLGEPGGKLVLKISDGAVEWPVASDR